MNTAVVKVLKGLGIFLGAVLVVVIAYLLYVMISYDRIPDKQVLDISGKPSADSMQIGTEYTAVTQNLGFGAYTADFTFFMDGGESSRAKSEESVKNCINSGANKVSSLNPDFILFQEVDLDSTRSYHINQYEMLNNKFKNYSNCMAQNYDSAYLFYPLSSPHGASKSSMVTYSKFGITSSLRRSFPISTSFSKFLDLDRCYSVSRIPVENGKEFILYNVHASAYGGSDEIRAAQMTMLLSDMESEYKKGNYVLCGGDFNHDFTGNSTQTLNGQGTAEYGWAQPFPDEFIPSGFYKCTEYKDGAVNPTCRNCDVPYSKDNFTIIVDGFIASQNIKSVSVENIVTDFVYSDHNPVAFKFILQ